MSTIAKIAYVFAVVVVVMMSGWIGSPPSLAVCVGVLVFGGVVGAVASDAGERVFNGARVVAAAAGVAPATAWYVAGRTELYTMELAVLALVGALPGLAVFAILLLLPKAARTVSAVAVAVSGLVFAGAVAGATHAQVEDVSEAAAVVDDTHPVDLSDDERRALLSLGDDGAALAAAIDRLNEKTEQLRKDLGHTPVADRLVGRAIAALEPALAAVEAKANVVHVDDVDSVVAKVRLAQRAFPS